MTVLETGGGLQAATIYHGADVTMWTARLWHDIAFSYVVPGAVLEVAWTMHSTAQPLHMRNMYVCNIQGGSKKVSCCTVIDISMARQ